MRTRDIVCTVICVDQRLLVTKRSDGVHEDTWELPDGRVESGEAREQAVTREIREELELHVGIDEYPTTIRDDKGDYTLLVCAYLCRYVRGETHLHAHHEYTLVAPRELYGYQFEAADQPILDMPQENAL